MAFQLMDDWLDFTQTAQTLGKPAQDDLRHGLLTAPVLLALEPGALESSKTRRLQDSLQTFFEQPETHTEAFDDILALIQQAGAIDQTRQLAERHIEDALQSLNSLPANLIQDPHALEALHELAKNVTQRHT